MVGGILWIIGIEEKEPVDPPSISDVGIVYEDEKLRVYQFDPNRVEYLHIVNLYGEYKVRIDSNLGVVIDGFEAIPLLQASSKGLFNSVATVTLDTLIRADCTDLAEYGLAEPQAVITIHTDKGEDYRFAIGNETLNKNGYYMCVQGEDDVYLMNKLFSERYLRSVADYCDKKIYKFFDYETDFRQLEITGSDQSMCVRTVTEEEQKTGLYFEGVILTSPFSASASRTSVDTILSGLVGLNASRVEAVGVTEADYSKYGLDNPVKVKISVYADPNPQYYNDQINVYFDSTKPTGVYEEFTVTYYIGQTVEHETYLMYEDYPVVYTVSDETFSFLSQGTDWYCSRLIFGEYIYNVEELVFTYEGKNYAFQLQDADSKDKMLVTCDGITVNSDDFRTLYGNLVAISHYGLADLPENAKEPYLRVTYHMVDGADVVVEFYEIDARNLFVSVGGEGHFSVLRTSVDKVIRDMFKVLAGESVQ